MPELPEVETIVNELKKELVGNKILRLDLSDKTLRIPYTPKSRERLLNQSISAIYRRAKYIVINLTNNEATLIHLGMSGRLLIQQDLVDNIHNHVALHLSNGQKLVFNDPRRFGLFLVIKQHEIGEIKLLKTLGPEPLSDNFNEDYLRQSLSSKKTNIKNFLMDATAVVGIGNIYASEILFESGISPSRPANSISSQEAKKLIINTRKVLLQAINLKGSTLKDYRTSYGDSGGFQKFFQVYGKEGQNCNKCGSQITCSKIAGRSTFYCINCQN